MNFIEATDVFHTYDGKHWVLNGISFGVDKSKVVAIVGPSGSGKSTLLKLINCLILPSSPKGSVGSMKVLGQDAFRANRSQMTQIRRQVGVVFQQFNLFERQSVIENVLLGRLGYISSWRGLLYFPRFVYSAGDYAMAKKALADVGLEGYAPKRASCLSGGQKQRVAIARALVQQSKIILADEPISNLDLYLAKEIMELLVSVARKRKLVLLISLHSLDFAKRYADEIIAFSKGKIVYQGSPRRMNQKVIEEIYGKKA